MKAHVTEAHTTAKRTQHELVPWRIFPPNAQTQDPTWNAQQLVPKEVLVWRLQQPHPMFDDRTVVRMFDLGDTLEIYATPNKGSELEKELVKNLGGPFGFRYRIPMSQVVYLDSMASMVKPNREDQSDWHQLMATAEEIAESVEDGDTGGGGDEEDEEEEEGETEEPPPPPIQGPPPAAAAPYIPNLPQPPLPPSPPNGQTPS